MTHWTDTKNTQTIVTVILGLLALAHVLGASFVDARFHDPFWHAAIGRDILANGHSYFGPLVDNLSFTFTGTEYYSNYLFDVLLAWLLDIFGERGGFVALRMVCLALFVAALFGLWHLHRVDWRIATVVLPIILHFVSSRIVDRPELLFFAGVLTALILYKRALDDFSHRNMLLIAGFVLLWVNSHTPVFAYVIFFGLFVDKALQLYARKADCTWAMWTGWGCVVFLVGFANPTLEHFFFLMLTFDQSWFSHIREFSNTDPGIRTEYYVVLVGYVFLAGLLIYLKRFGYLVIVLVLGVQSFELARLFSYAGVTNFALLAIALSELDVVGKLKQAKLSIRYLTVMLGVGIFATFGFLLQGFLASVPVRYDRFFATQPVEVTAHLTTLPPGPVLNEYALGGYLSFAAGPDYPVYIDGRTNMLYPIEFYRTYRKLLEGSNTLVRETQDRNIAYAMFSNQYGYYLALRRTGLFGLEYLSDRFFLMKRGEGTFQTVGDYLFRPACWPGLDVIPDREFDSASQLPPGAPLRQLLEFMQTLRTNDNDAMAKYPSIRSDQSRRLLAFVALEQDRPKDLVVQLSGVHKKQVFDLVAMAYGLKRLDKHEQAELLLARTVEGQWQKAGTTIQEGEQFLVYLMLRWMQDEGPLEHLESGYMVRLAGKFQRLERPDIKADFAKVICSFYS
ncbi:MAG: hypothetical protein AAF458_05815 [Pseudomonadota bacterium]